MNTILFLILSIGFMACKEKKDRNSSSGNDSQAQHTVVVTDSSHIFVGTYTRKEGHVDGKAEGIYLLQRNDGNGLLETVGTAAEMTNPSFVTVSPDGRHLYAVSEKARPGETGAIQVFSIDSRRGLTFLQELSTDAGAPAYVTLDTKGQFVFVANYVGGVVNMFSRGEDGLLTPADKVVVEGSGANPSRQESAHPHAVVVSPDDRFIYIPDLGSDKIWSFRIDSENNRLLPSDQAFVTTAPGAGPRHFAFHPNGSYAYVINELDNTINTFSYNVQSGELTSIQTIPTLPEDFTEHSYTADIHVHPNGKFLYGTNRGHNSIAIYEINPESGELSFIAHESTRGDFPRNFAIHPSGKFLYAANQNTDNIVIFAINAETGALSYKDELEVKTPVCIVFYP